jgi:hypothetical protein
MAWPCGARVSNAAEKAAPANVKPNRRLFVERFIANTRFSSW